MAGANENRAAIGQPVIDPVGDGFTGSPRRKIVIIDLPFMGTPSGAWILEVADIFLLFGVDTDDGQPHPLEVATLGGDELELAIALAAFGGLLIV